MSEGRTLARKGDQSEDMKKKRVDSTMTEGGFKGGEEGQARRASLEEEEA